MRAVLEARQEAAAMRVEGLEAWLERVRAALADAEDVLRRRVIGLQPSAPANSPDPAPRSSKRCIRTCIRACARIRIGTCARTRISLSFKVRRRTRLELDQRFRSSAVVKADFV